MFCVLSLKTLAANVCFEFGIKSGVGMLDHDICDDTFRIKYLLSEKARIRDREWREGYRTLFYAFSLGHENLIQIVLEKLKEKQTILDDRYIKPLFAVVPQRHVQTLGEWLLFSDDNRHMYETCLNKLIRRGLIDDACALSERLKISKALMHLLLLESGFRKEAEGRFKITSFLDYDYPAGRIVFRLGKLGLHEEFSRDFTGELYHRNISAFVMGYAYRDEKINFDVDEFCDIAASTGDRLITSYVADALDRAIDFWNRERCLKLLHSDRISQSWCGVSLSKAIRNYRYVGDEVILGILRKVKPHVINRSILIDAWKWCPKRLIMHFLNVAAPGKRGVRIGLTQGVELWRPHLNNIEEWCEKIEWHLSLSSNKEVYFKFGLVTFLRTADPPSIKPMVNMLISKFLGSKKELLIRLTANRQLFLERKITKNFHSNLRELFSLFTKEELNKLRLGKIVRGITQKKPTPFVFTLEKYISELP